MDDLKNLLETVRAAIWDPDLATLPAWHARGLQLVRTLWAVIRDVRQGDLSLRAMSLVYTTMLSIVPLLAISFSVLKGFGVHEQLETAMMRVLLPLGEKGVEIGIRIVEFVENVKVGDQVLFDKYSGSKLRIEDEECLILKEEDILGIFTS